MFVHSAHTDRDSTFRMRLESSRSRVFEGLDAVFEGGWILTALDNENHRLLFICPHARALTKRVRILGLKHVWLKPGRLFWPGHSGSQATQATCNACRFVDIVRFWGGTMKARCYTATSWHDYNHDRRPQGVTTELEVLWAGLWSSLPQSKDKAS